jgi:hypothetical protein
MFRLVVALVVACASAYMAPQMSLGAKFGKFVGAAALSFAVTAPMVANADGANSISSVYRARVGYGNRILGLEEAAKSGNFDAFDCKALCSNYHTLSATD